MSDQVWSVPGAVQRLSRRDPTLQVIDLTGDRLTDAQLAELTDCLLAHPDVVINVDIGYNRLTDETGVKLARYIAASSTAQSLGLAFNRLSLATYLALAAALRVNSSLRCLSLINNQTVNETCIDAAFVEALQLNPDRPAGSVWRLYSYSDDFKRLNHAAKQLGHPSLQLLLVARLVSDRTTETARRSCEQF